MKVEELLASLRSIGIKHALLRNSDGGTIVLSEHGGRVLGAFPEGESENLFWTSPSLAQADEGKRSFLEERYWNIGGERSWLSPELEFHIGHLAAPERAYTVQTTFDPGYYRLEQNDGAVASGEGSQDGGNVDYVWHLAGTASAYQAEKEVSFRLSKRCRLTEDPLKLAGFKTADDDYSYVGYSIDAELASEDCPDNVPLALWTLIQVPAGGEAVIPTIGSAEPTDFFNPTGDSHLRLLPGSVRFRIDATEAHKISLKAVHATGRLGYIRPIANDRYALIVRQIRMDPSGRYGDVPLHDTADAGHCIQLYNDNGRIGSFGELEYHSPSFAGTGANSVADHSSVWCYTGSEATIRRIARVLLGVEETVWA